MFGDTSQVEIGIATETSIGVLPASPAPSFTLTRFTGESLNISRDNIQSQEIRPDRNVADLIQVGGGAGGALNFELSYGTFDALLESLLASTWASNVLTNASTKKSFTMQKKFELGATDVYFLYKGMMANGMSLQAAPKAIVTGSFDMLGVGGSVSNSITGSNVAANTEGVMNAASHFTLDTGVISPLPAIRNLTMQVSNNLRVKNKVGSTDAVDVGFGQFVVTGQLEAYFESKALADLFLAGTSGGLSFTVGVETAKKYTFNMPNVKLSDARVVAGGNNQDVVIACGYQALYNAGIGGTLRITRAVA